VEWLHRARCKDEDPELFFPVGTTGPAAVQLEAARAICMRCDVKAECLEWAMATGQEAGVWGGLSEDERRALRRSRRRMELARMSAAR
jgi:WhiB family transcriptional regulator, redox-sensing transcriptional regulator